MDIRPAWQRAAEGARKFAEAVKHYEEALRLFATNAEVKAALEKAKTDERQQREDYKLAMDAAKAAIMKQNYQGAINSFNEALRILPGDKTAQDGLQAAQAAEMRRKQDFDRHMSQGKAAATAKKFPEAIRHYEEALKVKPNDPEATAALKRGREGKP